jgi:hypothetical protein
MSAFAVDLEALDDVLDQLGTFQRQAEEVRRDLDADAGRLREAGVWRGRGRIRRGARGVVAGCLRSRRAPRRAETVVATAHGTTRRL